MSVLSVQPTFPIFTEADGQPLENGYIWIGTANLDPQVNPIAVYWDAALTQPAVQPIRTINGYPAKSGSPGRLYVNSDYSIRVQNKNGSAIYSAPASTDKYSSELITFLQAGTGAVQRSVQAKLRESVSVKDFGAVGDGVTDDTAAIQAANNSGASAINFPPSQYKATQLTMTVPWNMANGAEIVFAGTTGQTLITCSGSNLTGNLNLSGGDLAPRALLMLSGNNNHLGTVRVIKIKSPLGSGTNTGVDITGSENVIDSLVAADMNNTGNTNDSMPQSLIVSSAATKNMLGTATFQDVTSAVVAASSGTLTIGVVQVIDASDNGLYGLSGHVDITSFEYAGADEPIVSSGSSVSIGTAIITKAGNSAIGVENSGDMKIGTLILKNDGILQILKTRVGNTASGQIFIGQVLGEFTGNSLINCTIGTIDYLSMPSVDVQYNWSSATSGALSQWCRLDSCIGFNVGPWNIRVIDTSGNTVSGQFEFVAPTTNLAKISFAKGIDVAFYQSDKITPSSGGDMRIFNFAASLVRASGMRWQSNIGPYGKPVTYGAPNTTNGLPAVGTWRVGERLFRNPPVVGQPKSWVCTVAGTPGTWVSEGNL